MLDARRGGTVDRVLATFSFGSEDARRAALEELRAK